MSIKSKYITSIGKTLTRDVMKPLKTALSCDQFNFTFNKKFRERNTKYFDIFPRFFTVITGLQRHVFLFDGIYSYYGS